MGFVGISTRSTSPYAAKISSMCFSATFLVRCETTMVRGRSSSSSRRFLGGGLAERLRDAAAAATGERERERERDLEGERERERERETERE